MSTESRRDVKFRVEIKNVSRNGGRGGGHAIPELRIPVEGTGIPGYPETQIFRKVLFKSDLKIDWIEVDEECRDHFAVQNIFIGCEVSWQVNEDGVSPHILAKKPAIDFRIVKPGFEIGFVVVNKTDVDRTFAATVHCHEVEEKQ